MLFSGPLPVERLLQVAIQIADRLARAHEAGIVHRDFELWKEFSFSDIGGNGRADVIPTPDGKSYVYGYTRSFADLFIAEGLK